MNRIMYPKDLSPMSPLINGSISGWSRTLVLVLVTAQATCKGTEYPDEDDPTRVPNTGGIEADGRGDTGFQDCGEGLSDEIYFWWNLLHVCPDRESVREPVDVTIHTTAESRCETDVPICFPDVLSVHPNPYREGELLVLASSPRAIYRIDPESRCSDADIVPIPLSKDLSDSTKIVGVASCDQDENDSGRVIELLLENRSNTGLHQVVIDDTKELDMPQYCAKSADELHDILSSENSGALLENYRVGRCIEGPPGRFECIHQEVVVVKHDTPTIVTKHGVLSKEGSLPEEYQNRPLVGVDQDIKGIVWNLPSFPATETLERSFTYLVEAGTCEPRKGIAP
jgi:hypothetical protein